jgi:hypothetical protein
MDYDASNQKKLNQFSTEARRWKKGDPEKDKPPVVKGFRTPPINKKKRKR